MDTFNTTNVPYIEPQPPQVANQQLNNTQQISLGMGATAVKGDQQGLWLGANKFVDAPFKVDMQGNITVTASGTNTSVMVWNDGVTNRIVIGKVS